MVDNLPIGIDSFRKIREEGKYYVDKTLMIGDFIRYGDEVALITRPRRFGKTLNMTMLREFFDITADSKAIFDGLAIMDTEYAVQINSRPVIFLSFKDCKASTAESLLFGISNVLLGEYAKYYQLLKGNADESIACYYSFFMIYDSLLNRTISTDLLQISIITLEQALCEFYGIKPIVLIDEYDQPIISSFDRGYHDRLQDFFSGLYGAALKGQECMHRALLTGIQRVVKESIFSQLNNIYVYSVTDERYSRYFGFTENETKELLSFGGLALDEQVKKEYDGYLFGCTEVYNPWSILNYAKTGRLGNYWVNTSTNALVREALSEADEFFFKHFDKLIKEGAVEVSADLTCSFIEIKHNTSLWGLLINSGYLTVMERESDTFMTVRIPNGEVRSEFVKIVANRARVSDQDLQTMFYCLFRKDMDRFMDIYRELVISCTSYFDAKGLPEDKADKIAVGFLPPDEASKRSNAFCLASFDNEVWRQKDKARCQLYPSAAPLEHAYHMLFLGMCISLKDIYRISSNIESGYGRCDIRMESLTSDRPHIIIEFKQGGDIETLKDEALQQILDNKYYEGLHGEVICMGVAHDKKRCALAHKTVFCQ